MTTVIFAGLFVIITLASWYMAENNNNTEADH